MASGYLRTVATHLCCCSAPDLDDTAVWFAAWEALGWDPVWDHTVWAPLLAHVLYAPPDYWDDHLYGSCPGCGLVKGWWSPWARGGDRHGAPCYIACVGRGSVPGRFYTKECCSYRCFRHVQTVWD